VVASKASARNRALVPRIDPIRQAAELRGSTGDLGRNHQTTQDAYENKFRGLVCSGIAAVELEPVDASVITAGILRIAFAVGRCSRPSGHLPPGEMTDQYTRFVLGALGPRLTGARS
jgi:hypothetical protein